MHLGIRYVGETTAKTLGKCSKKFIDFATMSKKICNNLEDIGVKVAQSINKFFQNKQNIEIWKQLKELGLQFKNLKKQTVDANTLQGQTFLFTGTLIN